MTQQLENANQLAKRHGIKQQLVQKLIAKIKPAVESSVGRGKIRWYNLAEADAAIVAHLKQRDAAAKAKARSPAPTVVSLTGVEKSLGVLAGDIKVVQEAVDELTASHKAAAKLLFDHIAALDKKVTVALTEMGVKV